MISRTYKVFLSFRGEDTRNSFVGHLYKELDNKGFYTFKDDEKLKRGQIIDRILDAINDFRSSLIVLSEDYASSPWCLDELSKVMECRVKFKQIVVPVFYKIDPSEVTDPGGKFEEALRKHEANFARKFAKEEDKYEEAMRKLKRWREDLKEVVNLSGWVSQDGGYWNDTIFIEKIVKDISDQLICESSDDATDLVGMSSHVSEMNELIDIENNVVRNRMVGIWGIDGLGKTTIARVIYDKLVNQFDGGCFLKDVGDKCRRHGLPTLIKELISKTLKDKDLSLWPLDDPRVIKDMLGHKKVLIVVDDVDGLEQLECLVKSDWFDCGSRIIVTTQDKQLLAAHGVEHVYKVPCLEHDQSLQLFCRYAFKQKQPKAGYFELSNSFLSKVNGHPFALKVLGSFLYGKSHQEWLSELNRLNDYPNMEIQKIMETSYIGLSQTEKDAFLDIACFFNGENERFVSSIVESCGFHADTTLRVLKDKALIATSDDSLFMHGLLQEMGRQIVRKESRTFVERSRLWTFEDMDSILRTPKKTGNVEGIFLDTAKNHEINIHQEAFMGLEKLRLLKLYNSFSQKCNVQIEDLKSISNLLRLFHWPAYPLETLPETFCPNYLVELNLPHSKIQKLWTGQQTLVNLLSIDLSHSGLTELPDLSKAKKLQRLNLQGCRDLVGASSVKHLTKIEYLNFEDCNNLRNLPNMIELRSLRTLCLSNCSSLVEICQLPANIEYLYLNGTAIERIPLPTDCCDLRVMDIRYCRRLVALPPQISKTESVKNLDIAGCPLLLNMLCRAEMDITNEGVEKETSSVGVKLSRKDFDNKDTECQVDPKQGSERVSSVVALSASVNGPKRSVLYKIKLYCWRVVTYRSSKETRRRREKCIQEGQAAARAFI